MRGTTPWSDDKSAISMALFERAMVDAFDAPDAEPLSIQALAGFAPEDSPRFVFGFHPSLILLELSSGTFAAYSAATADPDESEETEEAAEPSPAEEGPEFAAVWRIDQETAFRELDPDEYVALSEARAGRAFGDICQMAAFQQSGDIAPERIAQFLASWFEDGMVVKAALRD
jgi:hypothetical protein